MRYEAPSPSPISYRKGRHVLTPRTIAALIARSARTLEFLMPTALIVCWYHRPEVVCGAVLSLLLSTIT